MKLGTPACRPGCPTVSASLLARSQRAKRAAWRRLVSQLIGDALLFVDLAMVTLRNKRVPVADTQNTLRRDPGFDKRLGIVDGHFVQDVIARTREPLDDPHVAGVE